jgi:ATP-dependent Clp protease protease subunit
MSHPIVVREKIDGNEHQFDLYSRLNEDRIIFLDTDFNEHMASIICAQMFTLSNKNPNEDITIYINSPGGSVQDGLMISDYMNMLPNDFKVICAGLAASMGAYLLSAGTKGKRFVLPSAKVMIHSVSSGTRGVIHDMEISFNESKRMQELLMKRMAFHCGIKEEKFKKDSERDFWLTAPEAVAYGIADKVLVPTKKNAWVYKWEK